MFCFLKQWNQQSILKCSFVSRLIKDATNKINVFCIPYISKTKESQAKKTSHYIIQWSCFGNVQRPISTEPFNWFIIWWFNCTANCVSVSISLWISLLVMSCLVTQPALQSYESSLHSVFQVILKLTTTCFWAVITQITATGYWIKKNGEVHAI